MMDLPFVDSLLWFSENRPLGFQIMQMVVHHINPPGPGFHLEERPEAALASCSRPTL